MRVARFEYVAKRRPIHWSVWALLLLGTIALLLALESYRRLEADVEQRISERTMLEAALHKKRMELAAGKKPDLSMPLQKTLAPLVHPWQQVLLELEAANGERIRVVKFEHNFSDKAVHLVVAGPTYESIQALTERLQNASGDSASWRIQSISRTPSGLRAGVEGRYD